MKRKEEVMKMIEFGKREKAREQLRKVYGVNTASTAPVVGTEHADPTEHADMAEHFGPTEHVDSVEHAETAEGIHSVLESVRKSVDMSINALLERIPLRVAAYIRCKEDDITVQVTGLELQKRFMENRVMNVAAWTFAGAYIDQCSMNTPLERRPGFNALIENKEQYDLILCKSIFKLGRDDRAVANTLDELSKRGIYFYFEIEQLYTGDASWKVMWALIVSLSAQESMWAHYIPPTDKKRTMIKQAQQRQKAIRTRKEMKE